MEKSITVPERKYLWEMVAAAGLLLRASDLIEVIFSLTKEFARISKFFALTRTFFFNCSYSRSDYLRYFIKQKSYYLLCKKNYAEQLYCTFYEFPQISINFRYGKGNEMRRVPGSKEWIKHNPISSIVISKTTDSIFRRFGYRCKKVGSNVKLSKSFY